MFNSQLLIVAVVAAAYIHSASSFQPGSDYGVYKTTNLYNCTGHVPVSNVTVPNAIDTLPQIEPCEGHGWEQWSLFFHGTISVLLRWNQGDPSSYVPSPAQFDVYLDVNGTTVQGKVVGDLTYVDSDHIKQIVIGDNSLTWDSDGLWYNVSVNIDDYHLTLNSFSATLDTFHPNVAFHNGLLGPGGWFGSVPLLRGNVVGNLYPPSKQNITLSGLSVMKHMFSKHPLPLYIKKYTGGTFWGYSTTFYDSHVFYKTETVNGTVHEAAFLGRALPIMPGERGGFSSAWATYAVTDDADLYHLSIDHATKQINASFSGCTGFSASPSTNDVPYQFNVTTAMTPFASFTDRGGGKTLYYTLVNGSTTAPFDGETKHGAVAGMFEVYVAPSKKGGTREP
ncbi:hypothetical protein L210DRAFT_3644057 [Boletus edulis BED1]|uniref:Uncharacterized protein n=1 Tax=Boletus edulis BED1 TaxID=1328754 RepID=A0AAD4GGC0_BOLED|nr:hypothetical protein L210DRAFT_3644057 [Boletus edulis BED1]